MPRRRQNNLDMVDELVDSAVGALFERGADFFDRIRTQQVSTAAAAGQVRPAYTCASCRKTFAVENMQMIDPSEAFGLCKGCFSFLWNAGKEKVAVLAAKARKAAESRARAAGAAGAGAQSHAAPPRRAPWEVLGISSDASVEEINKAWRKLAAQYHPDRVSGDPNVTAAEREQMREMFDELTRCRDAMLRVRKAPS